LNLNQPDWQQVFDDCKTNVLTAIKPYRSTIKEPQPNLGIGAGGDVMKPMDLAAEKAVVDTLKQHGLSFTLVSEESGVRRFGEEADECYVTADPVDGSTNFMHGLPFYCCSVAISSKPTISSVYAGMVADLFHDVAYMAIDGEGAYRDNEKIQPSKTSSLDDALIGLDLNTYKVKRVAPKVTALIEQTKHIRHFGANALELCYVADGSSDAFVDLRGKLRTTDVAAGFLIIKEAGGLLTTIDNRPVEAPLDPKQTLSFIASGNPMIHQKILSLVQCPC
jgi:myo-inositol-1(or 4)-monophosphatase